MRPYVHRVKQLLYSYDYLTIQHYDFMQKYHYFYDLYSFSVFYMKILRKLSYLWINIQRVSILFINHQNNKLWKLKRTDH